MKKLKWISVLILALACLILAVGCNGKDDSYTVYVDGQALTGDVVMTYGHVFDVGRITVVKKTGKKETTFEKEDITVSTSMGGVVPSAGEYSATVTVGGFSTEIKIVVEKAVLDLSSVRWEYTPSVYDGFEKSVKLVGFPDGVRATYADNRAVDAGEYLAKATYVFDESNYVLQNAPEDLAWVVEKAPIDASEVEWNYAGAFTYTGARKGVFLKNLPEGVRASYVSNTAVNAGNYTATFELVCDKNHKAVGCTETSLDWSINKASVNMSAVYWDYTEPFTYDGTEKTVSVKNLPIGVTATVTNSQKTNAGSFTASVSFVYDTVNFELTDIALQDLNWSIKKKDVDMSAVSWDYTEPFTYDGTEKEVSLVNLPSIPVEYTEKKAVNAGEYTAVASFDEDNYNLLGVNFSESLDWVVNKLVLQKPSISGSYYFDGTEKTAVIDNIDNDFVLVQGNLKRTSAGTENITVSLKSPENTLWHDGTIGDAEIAFTVNKRQVNLASLAWDKDVFTYNGREQTVKLVLTDAQKKYVSVNYNGNYATSSGNYSATASLVYDQDNVALTNLDENVLSLDWTILKAKLEKPVIVGPNVFTYDGTQKIVSIPAFENNSAYFDVEGFEYQTEIGEYTTTIVIKDKNNFSWEDGTDGNVILSWSIK